MHPATAVVSGEGVELELPTAGVGSRTLAAALDAAVQAFALLPVIGIESALIGGSDSAALAAVLVVDLVLVLAGYPILLEWLSRGRTVGKLAFGLRVVRDDGGPIGFRHALVRGLSGLVLEKPGLAAPLTTIAGLLTMTINTREKRIGDLLAGTVVRRVDAEVERLALPPDWIPPALQPWTSALDLHGVDDDLALRMRQFVTRAHRMTFDARIAIGEQLVTTLLGVISPLPPRGTPQPDILLATLAERRRRSLLTTARPTSPAPETRLAPQPPPGQSPQQGPFAAPR